MVDSTMAKGRKDDTKKKKKKQQKKKEPEVTAEANDRGKDHQGILLNSQAQALAHSALAVFEVIEKLVTDVDVGEQVQKALAYFDGASVLQTALILYRENSKIQACGERILAKCKDWLAQANKTQLQMQEKAAEACSMTAIEARIEQQRQRVQAEEAAAKKQREEVEALFSAAVRNVVILEHICYGGEEEAAAKKQREEVEALFSAAVRNVVILEHVCYGGESQKGEGEGEGEGEVRKGEGEKRSA